MRRDLNNFTAHIKQNNQHNFRFGEITFIKNALSGGGATHLFYICFQQEHHQLLLNHLFLQVQPSSPICLRYQVFFPKNTILAEAP